MELDRVLNSIFFFIGSTILFITAFSLSKSTEFQHILNHYENVATQYDLSKNLLEEAEKVYAKETKKSNQLKAVCDMWKHDHDIIEKAWPKEKHDDRKNRRKRDDEGASGTSTVVTETKTPVSEGKPELTAVVIAKLQAKFTNYACDKLETIIEKTVSCPLQNGARANSVDPNSIDSICKNIDKDKKSYGKDAKSQISKIIKDYIGSKLGSSTTLAINRNSYIEKQVNFVFLLLATIAQGLATVSLVLAYNFIFSYTTAILQLFVFAFLMITSIVHSILVTKSGISSMTVKSDALKYFNGVVNETSSKADDIKDKLSMDQNLLNYTVILKWTTFGLSVVCILVYAASYFLQNNGDKKHNGLSNYGGNENRRITDFRENNRYRNTNLPNLGNNNVHEPIGYNNQAYTRSPKNMKSRPHSRDGSLERGRNRTTRGTEFI